MPWRSCQTPTRRSSRLLRMVPHSTAFWKRSEHRLLDRRTLSSFPTTQIKARERLCFFPFSFDRWRGSFYVDVFESFFSRLAFAPSIVHKNVVLHSDKIKTASAGNETTPRLSGFGAGFLVGSLGVARDS